MMFALVAMIAAAAFAAPEDWYAPIGWWQGGIEGEADVVAEINGVTKTYHCVVDENGYSADLEFLIDTFSKDIPKIALWNLHAMYEALQAQVMVYNMAENLDRLFSVRGITITPENGHPYTITLIRGTLGDAIKRDR